MTESVYTLPGLGLLTVDAVLARDYPTIQAVILLFSFAYVLINLLVDVAYTFLDPQDPLLMAAIDAAPPVSPTACRLVDRLAQPERHLRRLDRAGDADHRGLWRRFLGTRDPAEINPSARNQKPGYVATRPRRRRQAHACRLSLGHATASAATSTAA